MPPDLLFRLIGAVGGTIIALALMEPRSWKDLIQRTLVCLVSGILCVELVSEYVLGWTAEPLPPGKVIAASCLTAAGSWWIAHAIIRIINARSDR